ncbi:hypothetical protein KAK06_23955 [Ideonella sp. 4Y11]|uniref:Uncharacterized protein n=1 Tax=Ideonella aquatica TaxID=2824119 RepID=A0A940YNU5_9BURK|nr:hypothetical protein [Ideonella aquatica]MBQ0962012.1 hypothetical protein [Ideonella aquatica]
MAPFLRYTIISVLVLVAALASYVAGVTVGRTQSREAIPGLLASVQADLALNHIVRLRELESDLARGCSNEVLAKLRFDLHTQMYVLSSLYKEHKGTWVVESIAKREPTMPEQLEQFRKAHDAWTEPKCTK